MHTIPHLFKSMLLMSLLAAMLALPQPTLAQSSDQPSDADQDVAVTIEDLEVGNQILLPNNPFYFLKELSRNFSAFFTFDPIEKAEKRLEFAAEKIAEAQKMLDEGADNDRLAHAVENFQKEYDRIESALSAVTAGDEGAEDLLKELFDKQIKSQKIIDRIQDKVDGDDNARVKKARASVEERVANAFARLEDNPEELEDSINEVINRQEGSIFAPLKHLEVLQGLIEKLPEQAQLSLEQAYDKQLTQLKERLGDDVQDRFVTYLESLDGDEPRRFKVLESLENEDIPEELKEKISLSKHKKIEELKAQIDLIESDELKEELLQRFESGDFKNLKILKKIGDLSENSSLDEFVKETRKNAENNLEARLQEAQKNENLDELLERLGFTGDSDEIASIEDLSEDTIANLELKERLRRQVLKRIQAQLDDANNESTRQRISDRLAGEEPQNIEALERALENAPDSSKPALQRVISKHKERIENVLNEDSKRGIRIRRMLENNEALRNRFESQSQTEGRDDDQTDAAIERARESLRENLLDGAPEIRERLRRDRIRDARTQDDAKDESDEEDSDDAKDESESDR